MRFRSSAWDFMSTCVFTLDQADKFNPIKKFPAHLAYLEWLTKRVVEEKLLAIVKSRRMVITWTVCAIYLWDAIFHEGRLNALVSKKETDSLDLLSRCKFIYDNIPDSILPVKPSMEFKKKPPELLFPEIDSKILGFPQGADQLRQYTCSRIAADEMAFWENARETFVAMKPTIEGGGQIVLFSTRYPGFFQQLIQDHLDDD